MKHKIGVVTLRYDNEGKLTYTNFEPTFKLDIPLDILKQIVPNSVMPIMQENADIILAAYFSKLTDIELNKKVTSETKGCERWPNNAIKQCIIEYSYE